MHGIPIAIEADGSVGEVVYNTDFHGNSESNSQGVVDSEEDNEGELPKMRQAVDDGLDRLQHDEWLELTSNGEMEQWPNSQRKRQLDSAV